MALTTVTISTQYLNEILTSVGYPLITIDDLELTEDQIKTLAIIPSIREFYKWFPLITKAEYSISGSFSIDFPSADVFDILDARLNSMGDIPASSIQGNGYVNSRYWVKDSVYGSYGYGTSNDYGFRDSRIIEQSLYQSYVDKYKAFKLNKNYEERTLTGYSNTSGKLSVQWARYSEDFSDIPYNRVDDVLKLCKAKLLEILVTIRSQTNSSIPQEFSDSFETKRQELLDEVMNKWRKMTKVTILKG